MGGMKTMKIRTKLILAFSPFVILLVIVLAFGKIQSENFNDVAGNLETSYNLVLLSESIQKDIQSEAISLRNLFIFQDRDLIQEEMSTIEVLNEQIGENIKQLRTHANTEEQIQIMDQLSTEFTEFKIYEDQLIQNVIAGNRDEAIFLMNESITPAQNGLRDVIAELTKGIEEHMYSSLENEKEGFARGIIIESVVTSVLIIIISILLFRPIWYSTSRLKRVALAMSGIANGEKSLSADLEVTGKDEISEVVASFNQMTISLEETRNIEQEFTWKKSNMAYIISRLNGNQTIDSLAEIILSEVVPLVGGNHAVFYVLDEKNNENQQESLTLRASYAHKEKKGLSPTFRFGEGLIGQSAVEKKSIILSEVPEDYVSVKSGLGEAAPLTLYILPILFEGEVKGVMEIASFEAFKKKEKEFLEELVEELGILLETVMRKIRQTKLLEETQILMEEIQAQTEELESQQAELEVTNEELQVQQEELEEMNAELEDKTDRLEKQNNLYEEKNNELEKAKNELEQKARELALSSKYKSEFLANMSHELRTPLNSMLILSGLLAENKEDTLTKKQVEFAHTIHSSGKDLLTLINDILDLSKIESGKMEVHPSDVSLKELAGVIERNFRAVANERNLGFEIVLADNLPDFTYTDNAKLQQVLKNLLANAFKFTEHGEVKLKISSSDGAVLNTPIITFTVEDTGIGISQENQEAIFSAFQQEDGTISRKYGGTGLGLSISKEITGLLGGTITLESTAGKGSIFTLSISDYQENPYNENGEIYKEIAATMEANESSNCDETILSESNVENRKTEEKSHIKKLLIVEDDLTERNRIMEILGDMDVIMRAVSTDKEAIGELRRNNFDFIIMGLELAEQSNLDFLKNIDDHLKVFMYTDREITDEDKHDLEKYVHQVIMKNQHFADQLKKELGLFLNDKNLEIDSSKEEVNKQLEGKQILLVDDDVRNVYALSSILEHYGMDIRFAENGIEALSILNEDRTLDLIIMDIMMPEMDGYEAMKEIRKMPTYKHHPIIALTAKAMKKDREMSLEAGASDYITKPVDTEQLLSLIKVWLFGREGE